MIKSFYWINTAVFVLNMAFVVMLSGVMESVKTDAPTDVCHRSDETHICEKCCAEFFMWTELSEHHQICTKDPLVLIAKDNEVMPVPQESARNPVPSIESSVESRDGTFELRHTVVNDDSIDHLEEAPDCEEILDLELCPQDKQPLNCSSQSPDAAEPSSLLMSSGGTYSMPTSNVTLEILHSTRVAVAQFSQGLDSCGIGGKAVSATIPVILEHLLALQQQQVHQLKLIEQICSQVTSINKNSPQAGLHPVSSSLSVTNTFPSQGVIAPSNFKRSGMMSSTANEQADVSLSSGLGKSQSPPVQFINGKHTFRDAAGASVSSENVASPFAGGSSSGSNTDSQTNSTGWSQTLSTSRPFSSLPFLPQHPTNNIILSNPLASIAATTNTLHPFAALIKHRKRKLSNMSLFKAKLSPEGPFCKHKCRFCAKVFGSDSALQIHLRAHTGERPFKCNICGNRFSTKGNLKVHFQRHKDKYPHIQMNPYPVPEFLDNVPTSSGIPYGMSIPSEKTVFPWLDNKPVVATLPALLGLPLSTTFTTLGGLNDSVNVTSPIKLPNQTDLFEILSFSPTHRANEAVPVSPQSSHEKEAFDIDTTEGAFLPQNCSLRVNLVTNAPVSSTTSLATTPEPLTLMSPSFCSSAQLLTSDETKHPADSMQASESSKLKPLVENIDKKITDPNQCIVCHRVLSCHSALKMHHRIHTGERPYKCNVCGRAFTTKGNLKAHIGIHRENPPVQVQHSCPVCQKKFTNAILLQQHIRLHMNGQIPGAILVNGLQEMDINVAITERNVNRSFGSNSNHIDDISMDNEEEDEEGMEEDINPSKPLILDCNCHQSFMAALENQTRMVDIRISPSNSSGLKSLKNGLNDSSQLNPKCNLSEKKVENCSEIIPNMSEFYSSHSALIPPIQRNSESMMIRSTDKHNRPGSNEPSVGSVKKENSEAAAAMSQNVTGIQVMKLGVKQKALSRTAFQQSREQGIADMYDLRCPYSILATKLTFFFFFF